LKFWNDFKIRKPLFYFNALPPTQKGWNQFFGNPVPREHALNSYNDIFQIRKEDIK